MNFLITNQQGQYNHTKMFDAFNRRKEYFQKIIERKAILRKVLFERIIIKNELEHQLELENIKVKYENGRSIILSKFEELINKQPSLIVELMEYHTKV